jgi:hypothetical protein
VTTTDVQIGVATADDVAGILDLQERNLRKNGGELSVPLSREWLDAAIGGMPIIIARSGGRVVGYAVSSALADQSDDPILNGMLQAYPGSPGCYIHGPVCMAASERGKGVARAMVDALRAQLPGARGIHVHPRRQRRVPEGARQHGHARSGPLYRCRRWVRRRGLCRVTLRLTAPSSRSG